jgi:DNA-binding NarL/FixJ family response regulator
MNMHNAREAYERPGFSKGTIMSATTKPIRVLIADDHPIFRTGLSAIIANEKDIQVVGEASNGREAVEQFEVLRPDVTLLDIRMPEMDGIDALVTIRKQHLSARIIVLTTYPGDVLAQRALKAGALGYILKGMVRKDLVETIRAVHGGLKRVSADIAKQLANHLADDNLSARELEVLRLVATGSSNKRIAAALSISEETAKGHVKSILNKLDARDRTHAVALGVTRGIIHL